MTSVDPGAGGAQLEQYATATADATGAATFNFPPTPQGLSWVGNVTIRGAPFSATFTATVAQTQWGFWQGPFGFGPILCPQNLQLVVAATNLVPGQQYQAVWLGTSSPPDLMAATMPAPAPATPFAGNMVPLGTFSVNTAGTQTFDIDPATQPVLQAVQSITLLWQPASLAGDAISVTVQALPQQLTVGGCAFLGDVAIGQSLYVPISGREISTVTGGKLRLTAGPCAFGPSPIVGTLTVVGSLFSQIVQPQQALLMPLRSGGVGNVSVNGGTTATVITADPGTFLRVKTLTARSNGVSAANVLQIWGNDTSADTIHYFATKGVNVETDTLALDLIVHGGIVFQNQTAVNWRVGVGYEQWAEVGSF